MNRIVRLVRPVTIGDVVAKTPMTPQVRAEVQGRLIGKALAERVAARQARALAPLQARLDEALAHRRHVLPSPGCAACRRRGTAA